MDKAYIHKSISTSVQVANLAILGQLLFERMFPHADFQGRLPGHPLKVKSLLAPMLDASAEEIAGELRKMHEQELIIWYEAGGEKVIQLKSWWKFQDRRFAHPSKYPAPEGWEDHIRYNDPRTHVLIEEGWEGVFGVRRSGKASSVPPAQETYTGDLPKPPAQVDENHPSASSSASSSEEDQKPSSPAENREGTTSPGNGTEAIPYAEIVAYLNTATGKKFRHNAPKTQSLIRARWGEGFRPRDFEHAIRTKADEWSDDPAMRQYLRPETLFGTKFEGYLNQNPREDDREPDEERTGGSNGGAVVNKDLPPGTVAALEDVTPAGKRSYLQNLIVGAIAAGRSIASLREQVAREHIPDTLVERLITPLQGGPPT